MKARALAAALLALLAVAPAARGAALRLPPPTRTTLRNGLTVLVMPSHRLPLVEFELQVRAGSVDDPPGKEGLADLTAALLTQGSGARNARQVAEDIAFVGGTLEAGASEERTTVSCEVLKKDFATGLELLSDVVLKPTFPAEEFARKREEALGEIASAKDEPEAIADRELLPFLLGRHPLAHPVLGWDASVRAVTREDVVDFHRRRFSPDRAILAVVGDVDARATVAAIEKAFGAWRAPDDAPAQGYPPVAAAGRREVLLVTRPEATQSQIRFACAGVARNHPDYFPILVTNTILSSGFTSRLVNEIRVVQGLTYSIDSGFRMQKNAGEFVVTTFTRNETLRKTIDQTLGVVAKLKAEGPTAEELEKAKQYLVGQFPLGLQSTEDLAGALLNVEFYGLEPDWLNTFAARVGAVTLADCRRVLKSYFCTDDLKILVVTRGDVGRKALEGLGHLTVKAAP